MQKRLRIFAGPNGSGKSSMLKKIPESVPLGYYINADDIEKRIRFDKGINLNEYGVTSNTKDFQKFLEESEFARIDRDGMLYFSVTKDKIPNWLITYVILKS
ncbi:MAG: hypothetical protein IPN68_13935 [Bacteroidetes bacterium]|nr:hypothetical protein [Bacteroidota bacterium]